MTHPCRYRSPRFNLGHTDTRVATPDQCLGWERPESDGEGRDFSHGGCPWYHFGRRGDGTPLGPV